LKRFTVDDWCKLKGLGPPHWTAYDSGFGEGTLKYYGARGKIIAAMYCHEHKYNDSIAFFHIFGSSPKGPYYHNIKNSYDGDYINTIDRIPAGYKMYVESFGLPDRVMLNTIHWDCMKSYGDWGKEDFLVPNTQLWNWTIDTFNQNVNDRIDQVLNLMKVSINGTNHSIDFGLKTAVYNIYGGLLLDALNDCIRNISRTRNLTLYDYDNDVHSTIDWIRDEDIINKNILRDWLHPKEIFTEMAGEKLLSNRYSNYFYYRGHIYPDTPQLYINLGIKPKRIQTTYLVRTNNNNNVIKDNSIFNQTYFTINDEKDGTMKRYHSPTITFLNNLILGHGDVLDLSQSEMLNISLVGRIPTEIFVLNKLILVNTTDSNDYYLIKNLYYHKVSRDELINNDTITIDKIWLKFMKQSDDMITTSM